MPIDPTVPLVQLALDAAALRHMAIADGIANVGTPGYRPQRVNFEEQLGAVRAELAAGRDVSDASLRSVQPYLQAQPATASSGLTPLGTLDMEVTRLAQNTLHYQTLLRALSRHTAILSAAINEGRR